MTTLTVTLADIETIPLGPDSQTADLEVGVAYDRDVHLTNGVVLPAGVPRVKAIMDSNSPLTFEVVPSDSEAVLEDHRGFATVVTVTVRPRTGQRPRRPITWTRTVVVREADGPEILLGDVPAARGTPSAL